MKLIRYLFLDFFAVFLICISSLIALILMTRLKDIANLLSIGATCQQLLLFVFYQSLYVFPIACTLSCVISGWILFHRMHDSFELIAFRTSAVSLPSLISIPLAASLLLCSLNFYIASEISTTTHFATRTMAHTLMSQPIALLQHHPYTPFPCVIHMEPCTSTEAKQVLIAYRLQQQERMQLIVAQHLQSAYPYLLCHDMTLLYSIDPDTLVVEHQPSASITADVCSWIKNKELKISHSSLNFRLLKTRIQKLQHSINEATTIDSYISYSKQQQRCYSEIVKRFSLGIAPLVFTWIGIAFAIAPPRYHSKKSMIYLALLCVMGITSFFIGQSMDESKACYIYYIAPHIILTIVGIARLRYILKGAT